MQIASVNHTTQMERNIVLMKKRISIDVQKIQSELDYWKAPGMTVTLIQEGEQDQIQCFGYRDLEKKLPMTEDSKFCVASCSKSMTGVLIAALVDRGYLDLDTPVCNYVPEMKMWDAEASARMSLRDMLCHRTGLGGYDVIWPNEEGRGHTAERLRYLKPNKPFREVSQYSNLIYIMIGYVAERVTGRPWSELMKEYVFDPIGMDRTCCLASEILEDQDHAEPYQVIDGKVTKLPFWNMNMAGPAASVNSTARDMAKWIRFHMNGGKNERGEQIISEEIFRQIHQPQIAYDDSGRPDEDFYSCEGYGLGWRIGRYRGLWLQKHGGKIDGYSTLQMYLPEEKVGFILMMNLHTPSDPVFYPIVYSMMDSIFGLDEIDWDKRFRERQEYTVQNRYEGCQRDLTKGVLPKESKGTSFSEDIHAWEGSYTEPGYGTMTIETCGAENGAEHLQLSYRDQTLPLHHWGGEYFWMDGVKEDVLTMRIPVMFRKKEGQCQVDVWYEPLTEPAQFLKK